MDLLRIVEPGLAKLAPVAPPVAGPDDAVVRVFACGICGSDLTYIKVGGMPGRPRPGMPLGHEAAGEIVALGANVTAFAMGQRVVIKPDATSDVIGNGGSLGAFTQLLLIRDVTERSLIPIPDNVPYDLAALAEPLAVSLHGVNRGEPQPDDKVAVFGCGPIGLGAILWLHDRGVKDIVAIDLVPSRLDRARALGASATIIAGEEDVAARLAQLHGPGSVMGSLPRVGTDLYLDMAGAPGLIPQVLGMAKTHARFVITAAYAKPVEIDMIDVVRSEIRLTGAVGYPDELIEVVRELPRLRARLAPLISHRFALEEIQQGLVAARSAESAKVMIHI